MSEVLLREAFVTALGRCLPGEPVGNAEMEDFIGRICGKASRLGPIALAQNGIRTRHYALDRDGRTRWTNAKLAASALADALAKSEVSAAQIDFLAAATTQNDVLVPGFASMVHGETALGPLEIASFQSVCAGVMMALKTAALQVRADGKRAAAVVGSEFASRFFRPGAYENTDLVDARGAIPKDADFLRWTLSDGASAAIVEPRPNEHSLSLKIEWIELRSFADRVETCMWGGGARDDDSGDVTPWNLAASAGAAVARGDFVLRQDFRLLERLLPMWIAEFLRLVGQGRLTITEIDWLVCHYSAEFLRKEMVALLDKAGCNIPAEKWFGTLPRVGNIGSAAILASLAALVEERPLRHGQKILCVVPESGRCIISFALLTVTTPPGARQ
ncbi:MAG: 3-oxoacyl-ACP synthase [Proteobacteria bacterium]|nr:3-oxoacyl-ACP synthase [Pseudomonadota bacterium]